MTYLNYIASWFRKNNYYCNSEERAYILSILTIFAFRLRNITYDGLKTENLDNPKINRLLQFVNHEYGYLEIEYLKSMINLEKMELEKSYYYLKDIMSLHLMEFSNYDFNDYVYIGENSVVYFVSNDCILTDDDKDSLNKMNDFDNQQIFYVRRDDDGSLTIF